MKKRTFLEASSAAFAGAVLSRLTDGEPGGPNAAPPGGSSGSRLKNWAGNLEYGTDRVAYPASVEEVQEIVAKAPRLRALGTRHCFNRIADSADQLLSTRELNRVVALDPARQTVTVEAGIRYGTLGEHLHRQGYALHNLASLPHISVAGSIATATHGSGVKNGNLATAVSAIEFVTAKGEVATLSKASVGEPFLGAVVGLGGLGVVTKVTLDIQPTFEVRQDVYEHLPFGDLESNFEAIMSSGYSVSLFTDWQTNDISEVWVKSRIASGEPSKVKPELYGATLAKRNLHPIAELGAENCTEQMGVPGPWHERLPHFRMAFTPSSGKELQSEYFVPFGSALPALRAINRLGDKWVRDLFISEVRTIAGDELWMSPCYKRPSVAIHFTWKQNDDSVMELIPVVEEQLAPFGARPHWGKLFSIPPAELRSRYERYPEFLQLLKRYDPTGKFRNGFLDLNLA
ncbi:MAG: FAD-binding protein [Acidimicrobiia bacterium]